MAIVAKSSGNGTTFEPIPAGTYGATCVSMIHVGACEETVQGKTRKANRVYLTFEVPEVTFEDAESGEELPRKVGVELTLSMNEKATLRKFLDSWRGKAFTNAEAESFDVTKLLGKPCMLTITEKTAASGNVYNKITGTAKAPKGLTVPAPTTDLFEFNFDLFAADPAILERVPEFIQEKIRQTDEFAAPVVMDEGEDEALF